ncbi:lipopolysaccharide biosynthesis protein [Rhodospirillum rubrum]|uniref:GumC family protein n=1 Tax=Rhodospirillum rubrum TaxID=1085 RepID=UPI001906BEA7|nr:tyrosine-protein kinase domain-containing protein [Rhodospirillum rubrum]MBK1663490.1 lipopolysaccharide biosynthesis protein [Rhodospirillum rubrum]MBK1675688.1 lipopolysaccharide biosynthesis protein [Rhodospirillum rubrum]
MNKSKATITGQNQTFTLRDGLLYVFFHKKIILIGFFIPIVLMAIFATQFPLFYKAEARLMVLFSREQSGAQDLMGAPTVVSVDGLRATATEVGILRSSEVLQKVIADIGEEALFPELLRPRLFGLLPAYSPEERTQRAIDLAQERIHIDIPTDSNIVTVSFDHENRETALSVVQVLLDVYLDHRAKVFENPRSPFLLKEAERDLQLLQETERELTQTKARYKIIDIGQDILLAVNQVDSIVQRSRQMDERQAAVRAEIEEAAKSLDALPISVPSFQETTNHTDNDAVRNERLALQLERRQLSERYQADYPRIQDIDKQLDAITNFLKKNQPIYKTDRQVRNPTIEFLTNHYLTLKIEGEAVTHQVAQLAAQKAIAEKRVAELTLVAEKINDLDRRRSIQEETYREYNRRAEAARIEEATARLRSANVRVIASAYASPTGHSMVPSLMAGGVFLGLLLGAVSGVIAAYGRQVMLTPVEVEKRLGLPVVSSFSDEHQPRAKGKNAAEMIYLVARLRESGAESTTLKTIQIVSSSRLENQSKFVRQLAVEVVRGYGEKTLIIDLNEKMSAHRRILVRPDAEAAPLFTGDGEGLADEISPEVFPTVLPNLFLTENASVSVLGDPRVNRQRLGEILEKLGASYDVIILDLPPFDVHRIGLRYAPLTDGSLTIVRAAATRLPAALNLKETILSAGGDILGAVLTERRYYIPKGILRWL